MLATFFPGHPSCPVGPSIHPPSPSPRLVFLQAARWLGLTVNVENGRQQIAAELGISLVTLTDWMKKGLPYLRLNGRVYFKRSEVIASERQSLREQG